MHLQAGFTLPSQTAAETSHSPEPLSEAWSHARPFPDPHSVHSECQPRSGLQERGNPVVHWGQFIPGAGLKLHLPAYHTTL